MSLPTYIGANTRRLRRRLGLTQAALAEAAGIDGRHLQRIERGTVDLHVSHLERLAKVLKVLPAALLASAELEPSRPGRPGRKKPVRRRSAKR
jgi:transcriptional regulator with XRE-family HTH domain